MIKLNSKLFTINCIYIIDITYIISFDHAIMKRTMCIYFSHMIDIYIYITHHISFGLELNIEML